MFSCLKDDIIKITVNRGWLTDYNCQYILSYKKEISCGMDKILNRGTNMEGGGSLSLYVKRNPVRTRQQNITMLGVTL